MKKTNCMIIAFAVMLAAFLSCTPEPGRDARVIFLMGSAEIVHMDGKSEPASLKMLLQKQDTVKTGKGYMLIQIGDDILTRIEPHTIVELAKLFEDGEINLSLKNGQLISKVKKLAKKSSFIIKTPTAVASVRGTAYSVSYYKNRSVLAVKEGSVQIGFKVRNRESSKMINAGNTLVINTGLSRNINEFEALEIDKMTGLPYSGKSSLEGEDIYKDIAKTTEEQEDIINKKIIAKGGPIPKTLEEMLKKFGYLNRVALYSNKRYTGVILSRGTKEVRIMTLDGIESIPAKQVRTVNRTKSTQE